jgi:hypothetical protein
MTPTEKAQDLFNKMITIDERFGDVGAYEAKQCALVAADEIEKELSRVLGPALNISDYWQEVRQEIEKL